MQIDIQKITKTSTTSRTVRTSLYFLVLFLGVFGLASGTCFALENLDELEARTAKKSTNTFYSGESAGNHYIWQPQSINYTDTTSNHEITILTQTDNTGTFNQNNALEYVWQPWSADGKRMMIAFSRATEAWSGSRSWFVARADGTYLRPLAESSCRVQGNRQRTPQWSPVEPDVAYHRGQNTYGLTGLDQNAFYKITVGDTLGTREKWVDMIDSDDSTNPYMTMKDPISGDGKVIVASMDASSVETGPFFFLKLLPSESKGVVTSWNITDMIDTYWPNTSATQNKLHDEYLTGSDGKYWFYAYQDGANFHYRIRPWGTDNENPNSDISDHEAPYSWFNNYDVFNADTEIQPMHGSNITPRPVPYSQAHYWSHNSPDRWGRYMAFSDGDLPARTGNDIGLATCDTNSMTDVGAADNLGGSQYACWTGWTDWVTGTVDDPASSVGIFKYDTTNTEQFVANLHSSVTGDMSNPGQSPDGTKVIIQTNWLSLISTVGELAVAVAYFPYPPVMTQCTTSSGNIALRFEDPHYTTRGWPNESADEPSPAREIEEYRLWRSQDKITWVPIKTVSNGVFDRYDFSDGIWKGNNYIETTDAPGDGVWYYALTSKEWSGLESRSLSNIYKINLSGGAGSCQQDAAYPASPGDIDNISTSDFYTSYNPANTSLIRYYNIYAENGASPAIDQTDRIASIPVTADYDSDGSFSYVDWLGDTSGITQYKVTAVDTQGNESGALSGVAATYQKSPATTAGQYTIEWASVAEADTTAPSTPSGLSVN